MAGAVQVPDSGIWILLSHHIPLSDRSGPLVYELAFLILRLLNGHIGGLIFDHHRSLFKVNVISGRTPYL